MKNTNLKNLFAALIVVLISGIYVSARSDITVTIKNDSGEDRKLCVYNIADQVGVVPKICFTMKKNEGALWQNTGRVEFMVKVFKPALLDEYLYTRRLPGDTDKIIVGTGGRFGFGRETPPKRYFLKVCNQKWDQKVFFVLGFETVKGTWTEGWWALEKGKCLDFPVSEKLKSKWGIDYGYMPKIYFYAQVKTPQTLEWRGSEKDLNLCINMSNAFSKEQFQKDASGLLRALPCNATSDKMVRFRHLTGSENTYPAFSLNF